MNMFFVLFSVLITWQCGHVAALRVANQGASKDVDGQEKVPRVFLVTFANGGMSGAAIRLGNEARQTNLFDGVYNYTEYPDFITQDARWKGFLGAPHAGWWFWKPPLIKHILGKIDDGDILLYADAGCEIGNVDQFKDIAEDLCDHDIVGYSLPYLEWKYTMGKVFTEFGVKPDDKVYGQSPQLLATYVSMRNSPATRQFVQHWEDLAANYHLISNEKRLAHVDAKPGFRAHRNDQSLFSMLMKANQPDCQLPSSRCLLHPVLEKKHPKYGVPGLRAAIRRDRGDPPRFGHALILAQRNKGGGPRHNGRQPKHLRDEEASAMKQKANSCASHEH